MKKSILLLFLSFILLKSGEILLIDHDGGGTLDDGTPYEQIMINSLSNLGYLYKVWNYQSLGSPLLDTLLNYKVVIWDNACWMGTFTASDTQVMYQYLQSGGEMFILGPDFLYNLEFGPGIPKFLGIYYYEEADFANKTATGIQGVPYFENFSFQFDDFSNNSNQYGYQDIVELTSSQRVMEINNHPFSINDSCVMLYREFPLSSDTGRVVFFSASFEDILLSEKKDTFVKKVIEGLLKYQKPAQPDLRLESISPLEIAFDSILPVTSINEKFVYTAKIRNIGQANSGPAQIILYLKDYQTQNIIFSDTQSISPLNPGDTFSVLFDTIKYVVPYKYIFDMGITYSDLNPANNIFIDTFRALFVPFWDDFENASRTWNKWEVGFELTDERSYTGVYSFCEKAYSFYPNMADIRTENIYPISLKDFKTAYLSFWVYYNIEPGFDYCYVDISKDKIHYTTIKEFSGLHPFWERINLDISGYGGEDSVYIRLRFKSDPGAQMEGIFVDNFMILCDTVDNGVPLIIHKELSDTVSFDTVCVLAAEVYDSDPLQVAYLRYFKESNPIDTISVIFDSVKTNKYYFSLPFEGVGERIYYFFEATDLNGNTGKTRVFEIVQGKKIYNFQDVSSPSLYYDRFGAPYVKKGDILATGFICLYDSIELNSVLYMTYYDDASPIDTIMIYILDNFPDTIPLLKFKDYPENTSERRYSWNLAILPQIIKFKKYDTFYISIKNYRNTSGYPFFLIEDFNPASQKSYIYKSSTGSWENVKNEISWNKADPYIMGVIKSYGAPVSIRDKNKNFDKLKLIYINLVPYLYISQSKDNTEFKIFDVQGRVVKNIKIGAGNKALLLPLNMKRKGIFFIRTEKKKFKFFIIK